jgi:dihydrofolate reductase
MAKLVLTEWVTLDGYTAGPNNDMSFVGESFNDEMGKYESDIIDTADTLILGRVTYESFRLVATRARQSQRLGSRAGLRSQAEQHAQDRFFPKPCNGGLKQFDVAARDRSASHPAFKQEGRKDLLIYGSASIVQQLTKLGLVDEYRTRLPHPSALSATRVVATPSTRSTRRDGVEAVTPRLLRLARCGRTGLHGTRALAATAANAVHDRRTRAADGNRRVGPARLAGGAPRAKRARHCGERLRPDAALTVVVLQCPATRGSHRVGRVDVDRGQVARLHPTRSGDAPRSSAGLPRDIGRRGRAVDRQARAIQQHERPT